jgi:hypothetical protein
MRRECALTLLAATLACAHADATEIAESCGTRGIGCDHLARQATVQDLLRLRGMNSHWSEPAVVRAILHGPSPGRFSEVFSARPPNSSAYESAISSMRAGDVAYALGLAILCRGRCPEYRMVLERGLAEWLTTDYDRAAAIALALGWLGSVGSDHALVGALEQRRSWFVSLVATYALGRLEARTPRAIASLERASRTHWSKPVRDACLEVLRWTPREGTRQAESLVLRAAHQSQSLFVVAANLLPDRWLIRGVPAYRDDWLAASQTPQACSDGVFPTCVGTIGDRSFKLTTDDAVLGGDGQDRLCIVRGGKPCAEWFVRVVKTHVGHGPTLLYRSTRRNDAPVEELVAELPGVPRLGRTVADGTLVLVGDAGAIAVNVGGVVGRLWE